MIDIVDEYNRAERQGCATVSNRAIEAFSLELWNTLGYPYRVDDESQLWRYHDVMHEGRFEENLKLLSGCSDHEYKLITNAARQILSFSERNFPIRNTGKHALTRALYQYRLIMQHRPQGGPLRILEIGPGCGYLGVLLANDGHEYFAMEAAQAFYLYQKTLWSDLFGSQYVDLSSTHDEIKSATVTHIPWWRFANLSIPIPDIDIVTINHALLEMHENAVKTVFTRLYTRWGEGSKCLVLAENLGYAGLKPKEQMFENIRTCNFVLTRPQTGLYIFRPNQLETPAETTRTLNRILSATKRGKNFGIRTILKFSLGRRLAKTVRKQINSKVNPIGESETKRIRDFFDSLIPDERTCDEIFLHPRSKDL